MGESEGSQQIPGVKHERMNMSMMWHDVHQTSLVFLSLQFAWFVMPPQQGFTGLSQPSIVIRAPLLWQVTGYPRTSQADRHTPTHILCCTHHSWLIYLQIKSHEGGGCKVAESFCWALSGHPLTTPNFYSTYKSDSLRKRANPEDLLLHKLFYSVIRMGQIIWSLNGGFVPEAEDQSCKLQVLFFALTHHNLPP